MDSYPDKNSIDAVTIRAVTNGYMVVRAPSRDNPGVFSSEKPYVFQTIYQLTQWLEDNLERSDKDYSLSVEEAMRVDQATDKACAPSCPLCYPQTVGGVQGIGAFNRNS